MIGLSTDRINRVTNQVIAINIRPGDDAYIAFDPQTKKGLLFFSNEYGYLNDTSVFFCYMSL